MPPRRPPGWRGVQRVMRQVAEGQAVERCHEQQRKRPPGHHFDNTALMKMAVDGLVHERPVGDGGQHIGQYQPGSPIVVGRHGEGHAEQHQQGQSPHQSRIEATLRLPATDRAGMAPPLITLVSLPSAEAAYAGCATGS